MTHLQQAPPIPWQTLHHILGTLQELARATGRTLPHQETELLHQLQQAGSTQPAGTLVHFSWAVALCTQPSGYITATAQ